jgi:hypothetical protein
VVDAVVVPVEEVDEVVEAEAPSRVLHLVVRARRVAAFAFHREDPHLARARVLERHRLAERRGRAVARGSGVELEEEGLALHLRVAGETLVVAEEEQVLPDERALLGVRDEEARILRELVADAERLVVDGEHAVDERAAVARRRGTKRSPNGSSGLRTSQRMTPPRVVATMSGTFERDPPGWPDCRRFSIRSIDWSIRSPIFCHWAKCGERASKEGFWRVCMRGSGVTVEVSPAHNIARVGGRTQDRSRGAPIGRNPEEST